MPVLAPRFRFALAPPFRFALAPPFRFAPAPPFRFALAILFYAGLACLPLPGQTPAQSADGLPNQEDLLDFYVPETLPALLIFELDSLNDSQFWNLRREGRYLITERMDTRQRTLEYLREELTERGAFAESYATYTRDSLGRSTPLFAVIGSPDQFYREWSAGEKAVFSYEEPRRMDERMGSIRVERERIVLPDRDSVLFAGRKVAVLYTSDLVRLNFRDKSGQSLGEDVFLEFRRYGKGVGLLGFTRQFSDGRMLSARRKDE